MTAFSGPPRAPKCKARRVGVLLSALLLRTTTGWALPLGSGPPSIGLSVTGDASQTVVHPRYSAIGQTAQQRVSWTYDLAEDGARGDADSDTAALTRAIAFAGAHPGTVIHIPAGTWALTSPGSTGFILPSNTVLEGNSQDGTVITWNDDQSNSPTSQLNLFGGYGNGGQVNVTFRDFTVLGKENVVLPGTTSELGTSQYYGYPFLIFAVTGLHFDHVTVRHSRIMSIVARYSKDVTVSSCRIEFSSRDGISIGSSANVSITDNVVEHAGDDAIAVHSAIGDPWGARRDIIITGNRVFDAQGIHASAARSANISGNILDNIRTGGITVSSTPAGGGGDEGFSAPEDVLISNNVITNLVNRQNIDGLTSGQSYIVVIGRSARAGRYSGVPGTPGGDGTLHAPYFEFKANANDANVPTNPASGILITGNVMGRMIPPTDGTDPRYKTWTDLDFGPVWVQDKGNVSPSLALGDIVGTGVQLYGGSFGMVQITNNLMTGMFDALDMGDADNYGVVTFRGNRVLDMASNGVFLHTKANGQLILDDNIFDLDPYFQSGARGPNGSWKNPNGPLAIYNLQSPALGLIARQNLVRNAAADSNTNTDSPPPNWQLNDNIVEADPVGTGGFDAGNKGVGTIRVTGGFHLVQTDSDPTSQTYGQIQNNSAMSEWSGMPSNGKWLQGQAIWNAYPTPSAPYAAFVRANTGTSNALYADWMPVPVLINGNLVLASNKSVLFQDTASGKMAYLNLDTSGWMNWDTSFGGGDKLSNLRLDQLQVSQKIYLDASRKMWVQETGGKVVIGSGATNLFSIDGAGNVVAKGTIAANGSP